jgi:hypothetical protein
MLRLPLAASVSGITIFPHLVVALPVGVGTVTAAVCVCIDIYPVAWFGARKTNMLLCPVLARRVD